MKLIRSMLVVLGVLSSSVVFAAAQPSFKMKTCIDHLNGKIAVMQPINEDVSYMIADLKFDGNQVKICEFGEGSRSRYKGYDHMYGKGIIWERFWKILAEHDFASWYVDFNLDSRAGYEEVSKEAALDTFLDNHGKIFANFEDLFLSKPFARACERGKFGTRDGVQATGLVILRHYDASISQLENLRKRHKNILVLNSAVAPFVNDKYTTDVLFKDKEFQRFRPQAVLCKRAYTSDLAKSIRKTLPAKNYVIKPLDAFKGCGIIMVAADELDATLQNILVKKSKMPADFTVHYNGYSYTDRTYSYWAEYKQPYFIVEEMCQSKELIFEGKRYDPTMRVVFVLRYFGGKIKTDYLAAYWKLPLKSLDEPGSLTEKYKSVGIIPIDTTEEERKDLYAQLDVLLPGIYAKMIGIINNKTVLTVPLQV